MGDDFEDWLELFELLYKRNRDCLAKLLDDLTGPEGVFANVDEIVRFIYDGDWHYFFEDNPFVVDEMYNIILDDKERLREIAEEMGYDPDEFVEDPEERAIIKYIENYMDPWEVVDEVGENYVFNRYFRGFRWEDVFSYIGDDFHDLPHELLERLHKEVTLDDLMKCVS